MARTTIRTEDITADAVTAAKLASGAVDTSGITANQDDIALLGFKVAANGSLARYNLVDQSIDAFEDASGVDASASTNEVRNASKYYSGISYVTQDTTGSNPDTTTTDGDDTVFQYTTTGSTRSFIIATASDVDFLVIAGGGGGGSTGGGGGGAGGYRNSYNDEPSGGGGSSEAALSLTAATHNVVVGAGAAKGSVGADSSFATVTSDGGGAGGIYGNPAGTSGSAGGSGGGWGDPEGGTAPATGAGTANQGYAGSPVEYANLGVTAGGGGGAGETGRPIVATGSGGYGCNGGDGLSSSITGAAVTRAGGGGGVRTLGPDGGAGGAGGGGNANGAATDGTGGGGGGNGDGGNGIVILRFPTDVPSTDDMTLVSNAQTAESAPTTGDLVITYTNGAGTATINTDIKAYISRDGSAYTSAVTLVDQGDTGGHTILTANGVDLSGIASGTSMRWKIETLNQSASKDTRIQAVSLGWS